MKVMTEEKFGFEVEDLKFLKDLRFIYDKFNPIFVQKKYGSYIPVGILIVQLVDLQNKFPLENFNSGETNLRDYYVNKEYIKFASLLAQLIYYDDLVLIDPRTSSTFSLEATKEHIENLANGNTDDYAGLLAMQVAIDEVIIKLEQKPGISSNDPRIGNLYHMNEVLNDNTIFIDTKYHSNDVLYHSVKGNLIEKSSLEKLEQECDENSEIGPGLKKRLLLCLEFIESIDCSRGDMLSSYRVDSLWGKLKELHPEVFRAGKDDFIRFARKLSLFKLPTGRPKSGDEA